MYRSFLVPLISFGMITLASWHIFARQRPIEQTEPPLVPPTSSYANQIAGAGIVEPESENIAVGSDVSGIVSKVFVRVGQVVEPGTPLLQIDDELIAADVAVKRAELEVAEAELFRLEQLPRPEDLPPIEAQLRQAAALVAQARDAFERTSKLRVGNGTTEAELITAQKRYEAAQADLERIEAEEARLRAGAWTADKAVARSKVANVRVQLKRLEAEWKRHTITAPDLRLSALNDGGLASAAPAAGRAARTLTVLQINVRPGETVISAAPAALIRLGDLSRQHVRVDIDEHDITRCQTDRPAIGVVRGETHARYELEFVRLEPYVVPKKSLTGDNRERVDTRVLQAIFRIRPDASLPRLFVGQQMDVFIQLD